MGIPNLLGNHAFLNKSEDPQVQKLEARVLKWFGVEKTDEDGWFFKLEKTGSRPMEEILYFPGFGWRFTSPEAMLEAVSGAELYNYLSLLGGRQVGKSSGWCLHGGAKKNPLHGFFRSIEEAMIRLDLLEAGTRSREMDKDSEDHPEE